jgi:hypothetical protein
MVTWFIVAMSPFIVTMPQVCFTVPYQNLSKLSLVPAHLPYFTAYFLVIHNKSLLKRIFISAREYCISLLSKYSLFGKTPFSLK